MARPMYESKQDLVAENEIKSTLESYWKIKLQKLHYKYILDFCMLDENKQICGWVEVKDRKGSGNSSIKIILSLDKFMKMQEYSERTKLPVFMVWRFQDCFYIYEYRDSELEIFWDGRWNSQRDDQDLEPCVHIPTRLMKKFERTK